MNNKDLRTAVPDMPLSFARKMDETLERIENMEAKKRKVSPRALIICAVLLVTLIGSAIAATEYRVFDFLWHMNPLDGAENLIRQTSAFMKMNMSALPLRKRRTTDRA